MLSLRQLVLLKNSFLFAGGSAILALFFGLPLSFLLERTDFPAKKLLRILIFIPLLIPPYLHAIAWRFMGSLLGHLLDWKFSLYNLPSAVLIMSFAYFPVVTLLVIFALRSQDQRLEESALLFTSQWTVLRRVTVPLLSPAIFTVFLFIFILSLTDFGVPALLHVNVFVFEIFSRFSAFFNPREAFLLTGPLIGTALGLAVFFYLITRNRPLLVVTSDARPHQMIQMGSREKIGGAIFVFLLLFGSVVVPLGTFFIQTGSISNLQLALSSSLGVIGKSLFLSFLGASFVSGLTTIQAIYFFLRDWKWGQKALRLWALLLLALPPITSGIILIKIFNRPLFVSLYTSFGIIVVGFLFRFFPYASEIVGAFLRQIDLKLLEAAQLSGASHTRVAVKILLPLLAPAVFTSWLISFFLSLTELGMTILVYPPGWQTLPIRIFILMHYGAPELVAALSLWLIFLSLAPCSLLWYLFLKKKRTRL